MRLTISLAVLLLSCQLAVAAPPNAPNGPAPPMIDISVPQQDTRLVVVDFKIIESVEGKDQALANPSVAVPIGQTGEVSIGNNIPNTADGNQPGTDKKEPLFVGTKVFVTPVLRRDGKIQMTFKLRVSQLAGQAGDGAARSSTSAKSRTTPSPHRARRSRSPASRTATSKPASPRCRGSWMPAPP